MINKCHNCRTNEYICSKCIIAEYKDFVDAISIIAIFVLSILFVFLLFLHWFPVGLSICFSIFVLLAIVIIVGSLMSEVSEIEIKV